MLLGKAILSELFCLHSEKKCTLKRKALLPLEANSFLLKTYLFCKGFVFMKANRKLKKAASPVRMVANLPSVSSSHNLG